MDRRIEVIAYAGSRGEERPLAVRRGSRSIRVVVVETWLETGPESGEGIRRCFKIQLEDGETLAVYYDEALDGWFCGEDI